MGEITPRVKEQAAVLFGVIDRALKNGPQEHIMADSVILALNMHIAAVCHSMGVFSEPEIERIAQTTAGQLRAILLIDASMRPK